MAVSGNVREGDILKGRYRIIEYIAGGGMGRVWLASDLEVKNKQWAIKEVARNTVDSNGNPIEAKLVGEAEILSGLDHPGIVRIADIFTVGDYFYVVMDHVEGRTLAEVVRDEGPQSEERVQNWMLQVCDALAYLHNQNPPIIYRDMKPSNIMLRPDGYLKLIDFGVARTYKLGQKRDTIVSKTVGYSAPEQDGGGEQSDARTDIYGIGATMWHLLAGEAPPGGHDYPDLSEKNPQVGEGFKKIINTCTQLERDKRYQTCEELAANLEIYQELTDEYRSRQKRKVLAFAISGALAVVLAAAGFGLLAARDAAIWDSYRTQMEVGDSQRTVSVETAEDAYEHAISLRPDQVEPYLGLIECYKADGAFTMDEKEVLDRLYQQNRGTVKAAGASRYAELNYEIGRLYWYFYAYGEEGDQGSAGVGERTVAVSVSDDDQAARIKASLEYFSEAKDNFEEGTEASREALICYNIADFTTNIAIDIRTDDADAETYLSYWDNLVGLVDTIASNKDTGEVVRLDSYRLVANALETYADRFKAAGVSEEEASVLLGDVKSAVTSMSVSADLSQDKTELQSRLNGRVSSKVAAVYDDAILPGN